MHTQRFSLIITLSILLGVTAGYLATGQCTSCQSPSEYWESLPPFESSQREYSPYTLGLPVGTEAPAIEGVTLLGQRSLVAVFNGQYGEEFPILRELSEIDGLQVIAVLSNFSSSMLEEFKDLLGKDIHRITDPLARITSATYHVGDAYPAARNFFFIDENGTIVYRRLGGLGWMAHENNCLVRYFAQHGDFPQDAVEQRVLWYEDSAPWPSFPLETLAGGDFFLEPGRPKLLYWGWPTASEKGRLIYQDLDALRTEFPEVEFLWLTSYTSDDTLAEMWTYSHRIGLDKYHPDWYGLPLEEFLDRAREGRDQELEEIRADIVSNAREWIGLLDPDGRLGMFWTVFARPSLMILDADGTVLFPITFYPTNVINDVVYVHPKAIEELRAILNQAVERN